MAPPVTRNDLKKLARTRLREAKTLLDAGEWPGAFYLAGYAIECALKACIAKATRRYEFPDRERASSAWTHRLKELVQAAGLSAELESKKKADADLKGIGCG